MTLEGSRKRRRRERGNYRGQNKYSQAFDLVNLKHFTGILIFFFARFK